MVQFVIEHCCNCERHQWNSRHDEAKYKAKALEVQELLGGPEKCMINRAPKSWKKSHTMRDSGIRWKQPYNGRIYP